MMAITRTLACPVACHASVSERVRLLHAASVVCLLAACSPGNLVNPADAGADASGDAAPDRAPDPGAIVLVYPDLVPFGVAVDEASVYFTLVERGIYRTPRRGGPLELVALDDHGPHPIRLDADGVYAADLGTPETDYQDGRIVRLPKAGGPLQILASDLGAPGNLAVVDGDVYFAAAGTRSFGAYNNDGAIYRVAKDGSSQAVRLAKDQRLPTAVAVDSTYVYWTNRWGGTVMRCARGGCGESPELLYDWPYEPHAIVSAGPWLYWCNMQAPDSSGPSVVRAPKSGGGTVQELAASRGQPDSLLLDKGELYWVERLTHTIQKLPENGAVRPTEVVGDLGLPVQVVVDPDSVYFTDQGTLTVLPAVVRVPR